MVKSDFRKAVEETPDVSKGYKSGLQALKGSDRSAVVAADTRLLAGSVDIDTEVKEKYPNANRWDYAIGYSGKVCYKAPLLDAIPKTTPAFVWVQTKGAGILPQSSQAKRLASLGIKVTPVHKL